MPATTMMHIRVDEETKVQATQTLEELGLTVSDAVRLFLKRVVIEEGLPLTLKVPSDRTRAAIAEAESISNPKYSNVEDLFDGLKEECDQSKSKPSKES